MELDPKRCRRASEARDRRFDGLFFCGVVTTGIYCRPICPVRLPKAENVHYYPSAAACEEEGFRPCLRCRPETAPGTPAWAGSSTTVTRALRLIEDSAPEVLSVDHLAERLGVGGRHLRRLFARHLGASPLAIMRTRRAHFARRLIDDTELAMSEVALASGFTSIRQFNQSVRETFERSPTALRRASEPRRRGDRAPTRSGEIALHLSYRPPLDFGGVLAFLAPRAIPGVEAVDADRYRRVIEVDGVLGVAEVEDREASSRLRLHLWLEDPTALAGCVERTKRVFDLDANPIRIASDLARDSRLRPILAERPGLRVPGAWDGFELAVRAILGQQVSVRGATTLSGRLAATFGKPLAMTGFEPLTHAFPRAERLADADVESIGLPRARAEAIRRLSARIADGTLRLSGVVDPEEVVAGLLEIPGIGDWTAQYVAMRALGDTDAFPATDLGLLKAASGEGARISPAQLRADAESWRPWRSYAAICLWSSLTAAAGG